MSFANGPIAKLENYFKKISCPDPLGRIEYNFTQMNKIATKAKKEVILKSHFLQKH